MFLSRQRGLLAALFLLPLGSCLTKWHPVPAATVEQGDPRVYKRLMVITRDGYEIQIADASIRTDSVVGTSTAPPEGQHIAFAHGQVVRIESQEPDIAPTKEEGRTFLALAARTAVEILRCFFTAGRVCN